MAELLSWGLPIVVGLALWTLSYNAIQTASRAEDYHLAVFWFGLGSLVFLVRISYWAFITTRPLALRVLVCAIACACIIAITVESIRSINHKRQRWIASQREPDTV